jgi:riboflavin kinase/FMN adenylyltransferase
MKIITDTDPVQPDLPHVVLTIGSFDGVHLGHQAILAQVVRAAHARGAAPAALTLRPHPRVFFSPDNPPLLLTSDAKKADLLSEAGMDLLFYLAFTEAIATLSPAEFVKQIIVEKCCACELIVGHDFRFGRNAAGDFQFLQKVASEYGLAVQEVEPVLVDGHRVSSTRIRQLLDEGDLDRVEALLGRPYSLRGEVVSGSGIGRKLGFPTANLAPHHTALPADGIYAAEAIMNGARHVAAVNVGYAPTVERNTRVVEAYLLDFNEDIVDQDMEIVFYKRLRAEKSFENHAALTAAIERDVDGVRAFFA